MLKIAVMSPCRPPRPPEYRHSKFSIIPESKFVPHSAAYALALNTVLSLFL